MPEETALLCEQNIPSRQQIERLESLMESAPQVDLQTRHYFSAGLYAREVTIPAGVVAVGAVHKREHLAVCSGDVTIMTDSGMQRITGCHVVVNGSPGIKRVAFAHEDTVWTTFHPTDESELSKIEADLVEDPHRLQTRRIALSAADLAALEV